MHRTVAKIRTGCARYSDWLAMFGTDTVVLQDAIPVLGSAPGIEQGLFYRVSVRHLSPEQRQRAFVYLAQKSGIDIVEVKSKVMGGHGIPVMVEDVFVSLQERK